MIAGSANRPLTVCSPSRKEIARFRKDLSGHGTSRGRTNLISMDQLFLALTAAAALIITFSAALALH
jgi:hypothetical protein